MSRYIPPGILLFLLCFQAGASEQRAGIETRVAVTLSHLAGALGGTPKTIDAAVLESPLFAPGREPARDENASATRAPAFPGGAALRLTAIVRAGKRNYALVRSGGRTHRLEVGDELAGWRLEQISTDRIVLFAAGSKQTLLLRHYSPNKKRTGQPRKQRAFKQNEVSVTTRSGTNEKQSIRGRP
jgi:hypothetical protein